MSLNALMKINKSSFVWQSCKQHQVINAMSTAMSTNGILVQKRSTMNKCEETIFHTGAVHIFIMHVSRTNTWTSWFKWKARTSGWCMFSRSSFVVLCKIFSIHYEKFKLLWHLWPRNQKNLKSQPQQHSTQPPQLETQRSHRNTQEKSSSAMNIQVLLSCHKDHAR